MLQRLPSSSVDLLALPTRDLLSAFGSGLPTPGSGSAAALNGALACALIQTSAKLTLAKAHGDSRRVAESQYILDQLKPRSVRLQKLVQQDNDLFEALIASRRARDASTTSRDRDRHSARARRQTKRATEIALKTAQECVAISRLGLTMVQIGYRAAKGDPAGGTSNALAGAQGAACAALVNLRTSRGATWTVKTCSELQNVISEMLFIQAELMKAMMGLNQEATEALRTMDEQPLLL